jgi:16S rRNA (guanine966-N2)-methyltransferase
VRIIGGELRGKKLFSPRGRSVRPTADRLRETIFNIIAAEVPGAVALDLFAGTGALGIEALSRGASSAWFVDRSAAALSLLEKNLSACNLTGRSRRIRWDIAKSLHCLSDARPLFTLVFIDPPYACGLLMESGALVVIEHGIDEPLDEPGRAYHIEDRRRYGKSLVSIARYLV